MRWHVAVEHLIERFKRLSGASAYAHDSVVEVFNVAEKRNPRAVSKTTDLRTVSYVRFREFVNLLLLEFESLRVLVIKVREMIL